MGRFDSYSGLLSAFPYAFRESDSRLFKSYAVVSAVLGGLFAFLMAGALVVLISNTAGGSGGSLTLSRTFYVVLGLFVFLPLVSPVLFVARRHRRALSVNPAYDAGVSTAGYLFVVSVYLGVVASMPATYRVAGELASRPPPSGVAAPLIAALYGIPPQFSPVVPLAGAVLVYATHRWLRA
ncbi:MULTISPECIES: hypothetical protein [Halobacterium]|uniref:DUF8056 domain-containing protein n=4 Tax=Halobacterium salinarum TaxID=2242 RepID=Q9HNQ7_HALSA|nr:MULTISPECIES: hypothetical protein [Halobacterium]AAG20163.1 hypothetical protein VNG_1991H [Halobacterium salinarum NRC-1]MBB6089176.1 hypothetical protein [Halobacterium salinarum]MCF2166231.1 hypothetical protein [Halobacterium salinarum]MCF2167714.1 hypothetical protein [Halobacterium salinarum]MCF2239412.1 hypothetical protein [Halobacterium salinarum]